MFAVRFLDNLNPEKLYGTYGMFSTLQKATWWATHECDGKAFTVHNLGD